MRVGYRCYRGMSMGFKDNWVEIEKKTYKKERKIQENFKIY